MRFSCLMIMLLGLGCAEDPILAKVNSEKSQDAPPNLDKKTSDNQTTSKEIEPTMPTIAPPKGSPKPKDSSKEKDNPNAPVGQLPKVAPPSVEPPKEQPKEAVPPPPPNPKDGEFITITGTIDANNPNNKPIRIDIFDGDQRNIGGKRPSVVVSTTVEAGPEFEIFLPKKEQMLWVGAYIDEDGNGRPGPLDPSGWYSGNPISGEADHSRVVLTLGIPNDAPP